MSFYKNIEFVDLGVKSEKGFDVFEDISFKLPLNSVTWVTGSEGSGRSLFLKLINGVAHPTTGKVVVNDQNLSDLDFNELQVYRLNSGYSFDFGGLINNRTLYENLLLPLEYHSINVSKQNEIVDDLVDRFKIPKESLNSRPAEVRGGLRKAICLVRAFVFNPELILLDDPTTGLNSVMRSALKEYILELKKQSRHIFIATDDMDFISDITDNSIYLDAGKLVFSKKEKAA